MKANMDEYKKELHFMIDKFNNLSRIMRLYSYVKKVFKIEMAERKEG